MFLIYEFNRELFEMQCRTLLLGVPIVYLFVLPSVMKVLFCVSLYFELRWNVLFFVHLMDKMFSQKTSDSKYIYFFVDFKMKSIHFTIAFFNGSCAP